MPAASSTPAARPESGEISFLLAIDNDSGEEESSTHGTVAYWQQAEEGLRFAASIESIGALNGTSAEFTGGLTYAPEGAALEYDGQSYSLDPAALAPGGGAVAGCQRALQRVPLTRLLEPSGKESRQSGAGEDVTLESVGDLEVSVLRQVLRQLAMKNACGVQLHALPFFNVLAKDVGDALGRYGLKSRVELDSDRGGSLRRLLIRAFLHPQNPGEDEYDGLLELTLTREGEVPRIPVPPPGKPIRALRKRLGAEQAEELEAAGGSLAGLVRAAVGGRDG